MSLIGKKWEYISEGNVHIVLGITGTEYVIRLIKEDEFTTDMDNISNTINFVNSIMIPLIFGDNRYTEDLIKLSDEEVSQLTINLIHLRPKNRQIKVLSHYAIRAPNLTIISPNHENYCVEIKPKEGFISAYLGKYSKCYYCLKQFLKLKTKQIDKISNYCPLDLFSGDRIRMMQALVNLSLNPQNNFKIFKNGKIVYSEKSSFNDFENFILHTQIFKSMNMFLNFIIDILLCKKKYEHTLEESTQGSTNKPEKCVDSTSLCPDSFLFKLLTIQKLTEISNADSINANEGFKYVPVLLKHLNDKQLNLTNLNDQTEFLKTIDPMHSALISAIAKDCSIMIAFSLQTEKPHPYIEIGETKIFYRISVTDLEPKPIKTLPKRKKTEQKLLDLYEKYEDMCKIQPHSETRAKQLEAWQQLISDYLKATKQSTIDVREAQNSPLFNNPAINRKLSSEALLTILEDMAKNGKAAPIDKSKNIWEIYWHSLDEWGNMIYGWANCNGLNNSVCTLFELREGENTVGEEFHGLDMNILIKALKALEVKGKCELMEFDDSQGVKFF